MLMYHKTRGKLGESVKRENEKRIKKRKWLWTHESTFEIFISLLKNIPFQPWKLEEVKQLTLIGVKDYWTGSYLSSLLMTNEMHNSYNQFLFHSFFCLLYMFRKNLILHHQQHGVIYCITQYSRFNRAGESRLACPIVPIVPNCVIQYIMPCSWWWTTRFVRNM